MTEGIVFFKEIFDFMDDMTPAQYFEFMRLIRDLRFNGIDTDVNDVKDKVVRLAWRSVRPSIQKSARNAKDYETKKNKKKETDKDKVKKWAEELLAEDSEKLNKRFYNEWGRYFNDVETAMKFVNEFNRENKKKE